MKVIAVFDNDLKSVKFIVQETGEEVDPRAVLTNLAYERVKIIYESSGTDCETWALEPTEYGLKG